MQQDDYSSYDSQQEDDQVDPIYLNRVLSHSMPKSHDYLQIQNRKIVNCPQEDNQDDQEQLKPKIKPKIEKKQELMRNQSNVSKGFGTKSTLSKRPLTAAYTFKLPKTQSKKRKNDPVSLFQSTSQSWKKDRFLTSRANNKQGRKLELDKRNLINKYTQVLNDS